MHHLYRNFILFVSLFLSISVCSSVYTIRIFFFDESFIEASYCLYLLFHANVTCLSSIWSSYYLTRYSCLNIEPSTVFLLFACTGILSSSFNVRIFPFKTSIMELYNCLYQLFTCACIYSSVYTVFIFSFHTSFI